MKFNSKNTIIFWWLALTSIASTAQVELSGIAGQKFSVNYPILNESTTYANIPLPEGVWTVVRGDDWTTSNGRKMRGIFLNTTTDVINSPDTKKILRHSIYINTSFDSSTSRWLDEPCKGQDFIYSNKYSSGIWDQRCLTIRQEGYLAKSDNKVQQIARDFLNNNNTAWVSGRLTIKNVVYNGSGRFLEVSLGVFPTNYGFEKPYDSVDSPWHLSRYKSDPEKVRFIDKLKEWSETYSDIIYSNFQSGKLSTVKMPEFVFISANSAKVISPPVSIASALVSSPETAVFTPPPTPVLATPSAPARVAAIANVDFPVKVPVGQVVPNQPTQITANPIEQVKKTGSNEVWISFNPSISVQERQFCRIVENFRTENALAFQSKNQIKVNETFRSLSQSLNSLLPDGKFQGWVMRTVAVDQASDGSAEVLLEMPCNIYVGSNACDANPSNYYGTAPEGSRMYTELAKMTVGDFVLTNGQFVYTDDKAFDKTRSVASFRYMRTAAHCKAREVAADTEFFGIKLDVISTIK
jgi:hypothetical protein